MIIPKKSPYNLYLCSEKLPRKLQFSFVELADGHPESLSSKVKQVRKASLILLGLNGYPLVIKHDWLENGPFKGDCPIKASIYRGLSLAMFDYQRVHA